MATTTYKAPQVKWWKWATALFTGGGLGGGVVIGLLIGWSTPQVVTITRDVIQPPAVTPGRPGVGVNHSRDLLIEWSRSVTWKRDAEQEAARKAVEADR